MGNDWFEASDAELKLLGNTPGLLPPKRGRKGWLFHRSHLPILNEFTPPVDEPVDFFEGRVAPRDHQVEDVQWLRARDGALLANQQRLGKTASAIASASADKTIVVVAPLATRRVWKEWFARRFPDEEPSILSGTKFDGAALDSRIVWMHYGILRDWMGTGMSLKAQGRKLGTLIFDEIHLLSNRDSSRSRAGRLLASTAEQVYGLTGTPLWNKVDGLWSILTILSPGAWGSYHDFTARYCEGGPGAYGWTTGDPKNSPHLPELAERLTEVMRALRWKDVGDAPPTYRETISVEVPPNVRRDLNRLVDVGHAETKRPTYVGDMARYRKLIAGYKAKAAADKANEIASYGDPCVVWVWHQDSAKAVKEGCKFPVFEVTSKVSERKREGVLDEWRGTKNGILIMSIQIGQAGIDLSHARHTVFAEIDWTPAVISQAEMRTFAPVRPNYVFYVVADHEVDRALAETIAVKCETSKLVGAPASDSAIDEILQYRPEGRGGDLTELAARIAEKVAREGTSFEERIRRGF